MMGRGKCLNFELISRNLHILPFISLLYFRDNDDNDEDDDNDNNTITDGGVAPQCSFA